MPKFVAAHRGIGGTDIEPLPEFRTTSIGADPKSDLIKKVERSLGASKRDAPADIGSARELAKRVLDAVPAYESTRLRTLANVIGAQPDVCYDRVYVGIATAAELFEVDPGLLVQQIEQTKTTVGTLMSQSGKK